MSFGSMTPIGEESSPKTLGERIASHKNALTLKEFAELLSISYNTAFEMASHGKIPAMRIGSNWRLDPAELVAWLEEQKVGASARIFRPAQPVEGKCAHRPLRGHVIKQRELERLQSQIESVGRRIARARP
jgi:excisionase family DNA binding protein